MRRELRHILRGLGRTPWYSATIVGVMALTLTLATVVFAIVDGVLFRPLPYPNPEQLFLIEPGVDGVARPEYGTSVGEADVAAWAAAAPGVRFTAFRAQPANGLGPGVNDFAAGMASVEPNIFDVLGVRPIIGGFTDEDFAHRTMTRPVVITWDVWQDRFGGEAGIAGRTTSLDPVLGTAFRVVGVMPEGFAFPSTRTEVQFLMPRELDPLAGADPRRRPFTEVIARAPAAIGPAALEAPIEAGMRTLASTLPPVGPNPGGWTEAEWRLQGPYDRADVVRLTSSLGRESRALFMAVFTAVMVLVVLGALNSSGLMAARALDRQREMIVRRALGASRAALGKLVLTETLVLLAVAAGAALLVAPPLLRFGARLLPENLVLLKPWGVDALDWRTVRIVALGALVLSVPMSIWPVTRAVSLSATMRATGSRVSDGRSLGRFAVVSAQVAGALVLMVLGSMLVGSLLAVYANPLPIRTGQIVTLDARMLGGRGLRDELHEREVRVTAIVERLRRLSGVIDVAAVDGQVLTNGTGNSRFRRPETARSDRAPAHTLAVSADFFRMLRPQLVAGRLPTPDEIVAGAPIVVVSEQLARDYWPGEPAIGHLLESVGASAPFAVIGVVRDVPWLSWDAPLASAYGPYASLSRTGSGGLTLFIETSDTPARVIRAVQHELHDVEVRRAGPLADEFVETVRDRRFRSWLFGSFAAAALIVVGVGMLGLIAMSTARRTREIGIRQALGATRQAIVTLVVTEQLAPVLAGLAMGGLVAAWAVRFVESYLYAITSSEPRVWTVALVLLLATTSVGAALPAVRASGTDPASALRAD
jgi:predicted permease